MPFLRSLVLVLFQLSLVYASPRPLGSKFESRDSLPLLSLPYATYRAADYNPVSDIYTFKNIRYAAPPVGNLRWAKPAAPLPNATIQDGSYGPKCVQSAIRGLNLIGSGNNSPVGAAINQFLGGIPVPLFQGGDEDCLFLDVYVPRKAVKNPSLKLPVVVFIHGGGYVFGSKDSLQPELPFYDGSGMIQGANNNMIFVAINYRLGSYGFLAGTTMENEGVANAGLWDQRAAFQWVRDYISLVGGDPVRVTAMGESAGASSILHHLVAQGGKLDPLFSRAILQSPAFELMWDRAGTVEQTFHKFASLAGCQNQSLACIRAADPAVLVMANKQLNDQQTSGTFAVGPTPDGSFIRQLPVLELATGNFWKIESLVLSHCAQESRLFVSGAIETDAEFSSFLDAIFPSYARAGGLTQLVESFYPPLSGGKSKSPYATQSDRMEAFLRDSCFTCNIRYLTEAFGDSKVWNMQYSVSPGIHGSDLVPTFFNPTLSANSLLEDLAALFVPVVGPLLAGLSAAMQSYFTSYILTGDPNTNRKIWNVPSTVRWDHPSSSGEQINGVVNVGNLGFSTINDAQTLKSACSFWKEVAAAATSLGGYAPPGAMVKQTLVNATGDPNSNYMGGNASR